MGVFSALPFLSFELSLVRPFMFVVNVRLLRRRSTMYGVVPEAASSSALEPTAMASFRRLSRRIMNQMAAATMPTMRSATTTKTPATLPVLLQNDSWAGALTMVVLVCAGCGGGEGVTMTVCMLPKTVVTEAKGVAVHDHEGVEIRVTVADGVEMGLIIVFVSETGGGDGVT